MSLPRIQLATVPGLSFIVTAAIIAYAARFVLDEFATRRAHRLSWLSIGHGWLETADECASLPGADSSVGIDAIAEMEARGIQWIAYALGLVDAQPTSDRPQWAPEST